MRYKRKEKYINIPLTLEYYEQLKEIAKLEGRFICRQGSQFIKRSIDKHNIEQKNNG